MSEHRTLACKVGGCKTAARPDAKVCSTHQHTLSLQAEIVRLNQTTPDGISALVRGYPHLRRLIENLATLVMRADPLKAASTQIVARSRSHNLGDGIVALGDHLVTPGYAASTLSDRGRLQAADRAIAKCANDVERIVTGEPKPKPKDLRPRCNRRSCNQRGVRQPIGVRLCGFCGLPMNTGNTVPAPAPVESREDPDRSLTIGELRLMVHSAVSQHLRAEEERKRVQFAADRRGLMKAVRIAQKNRLAGVSK